MPGPKSLEGCKGHFAVELYRLYRQRVELMIQTADTDYAADYDTDYEKPIKSRSFDHKSSKIAYFTPEEISEDLS